MTIKDMIFSELIGGPDELAKLRTEIIINLIKKKIIAAKAQFPKQRNKSYINGWIDALEYFQKIYLK